MNKFGEFLKMIREEEKITIKELAEKSGLSCVTISLIEKGQSKPNPVTIAKLSQALGCDYDLLAKYTKK
ncbi:MAG: helix-turn-helix transcriptional regulator [Bacilli bacterium]|nr:helix-turn-helix transcriptional regulator [Bacilli bacterium]